MGAVYREELSANARKLIEQLLSLPQGWVTAAALAESIGVSRRTVLRELPAVEQWMQAAGAHFVRNPGKGLLLDEAPERRDALRTQLNSGDRKELSRAERRQQLLTRLLSEQEPCKTAVLARALGVSESTLSADLDELETKLHPYRVEMFRRPGVGVWLQGDASSYRRVVSALLRSSMPEKELAEVLCGRMPENEIFSTLLDTKTAEKVWAALQQFEQEEQLHLPDAGFLALAIHCTLTIQQLRQGGDKGSAPRGLRPAGNHAARLVAALNRAFGLTLPSEEAQYLELYLSAYLGAEDPWGSAQEMELRNLEAALIREMEKALHTDLSGYTSLRDDLYCHLRPMLLRVEQNIRTENPQLDTIRTDYPGLWKATRAACDAVQQLRRRETLGDTYIKPLYALLLHCRTSAVKDCRLGYLQAQPPVYEPGRIVLGALVLLAPDDGNGVPVEVMQNVSGQLIETSRLMEALRTGQQQEAADLLEQGFDRGFFADCKPPHTK